MTEDISTTDHIALFLVCNHVAAAAGIRNVELIYLQDEHERVWNNWVKFMRHRMKLGFNKYMLERLREKGFERQEPLTFGQIYESDYRRSGRRRRAPDRLNIKTTRTHSYQN